MRFGSVSYLNAPAKVPRERLRRTFAGGLPPPQRGRAGAPKGGGHRISDITGGPRNPALTRVITGPNGPPDIYMISGGAVGGVITRVSARLRVPPVLSKIRRPPPSGPPPAPRRGAPAPRQGP